MVAHGHLETGSDPDVPSSRSARHDGAGSQRWGGDVNVAAVDASAWLWALGVLGLIALGVIAWTVPFVAAADMGRRGQSRVLWWLIVLCLPVVGLVAWLIARSTLRPLDTMG